MGSVLTIASGKGGVAKTSTAIILSTNLVAAGYRVAVIDADRNQSFASWHAQAYEGPAFICKSEVDNIRVVDLAGELAETHDVVIVDTAGFESLTAAAAVGMADFVIIPCMPDRGSVRETLRSANQVASLSKAARRTIPYSVICCRWYERGLAERAALDDLRAAALNVMETTMSDLAGYKKLSFSGMVPTVGKIKEEALQLIAELAANGAIPDSPDKETSHVEHAA